MDAIQSLKLNMELPAKTLRSSAKNSASKQNGYHAARTVLTELLTGGGLAKSVTFTTDAISFATVGDCHEKAVSRIRSVRIPAYIRLDPDPGLPPSLRNRN